MSKHPLNLVWIDLEMTGLDPEHDRIIEIATIVTDADLNTLEEGPEMAIHQSDEMLEGMDDWNTRTHGNSGLTERVQDTRVTELEAEKATLEFIRKYVPGNASPLCGNSICQDRRFLYKYMPKLSKYLHYRNVDVSSVKEMAKRWHPEILTGFDKRNTHQAMDDIRESIAELQYYRKHFIV